MPEDDEDEDDDDVDDDEDDVADEDDEPPGPDPALCELPQAEDVAAAAGARRSAAQIAERTEGALSSMMVTLRFLVIESKLQKVGQHALPLQVQIFA
jgi:hypothetical protein